MNCSRCAALLTSGDLSCPRCKLAFGQPVPYEDYRSAPVAPIAGAPPVPGPLPAGAAGTSVGVFIGILAAFVVICVVGGLIFAGYQQSEADRRIDSICRRYTNGTAQAMEGCRRQLRATGY